MRKWSGVPGQSCKALDGKVPQHLTRMGRAGPGSKGHEVRERLGCGCIQEGVDWRQRFSNLGRHSSHLESLKKTDALSQRACPGAPGVGPGHGDVLTDEEILRQRGLRPGVRDQRM